MRTGCPICGTVFRITPEQLRVRAGKVRCGQCHSIFNALESLIEETVSPGTAIPAKSQDTPPPPAGDELLEPAEQAVPDLAEATDASVGDHEPRAASAGEPDALPSEPEPLFTDQEIAEALPDEAPPTPEPAAPVIEAMALETPSDESPEESTQAAREAGLMAARELSESPGYNRWAAGTLASSPLAGLGANAPGKPAWPFVLVALLLLISLAGQLVYHFRTELVQRLPSALGAFDALDIAVPLPRVVDLVSIEASDLQADNPRALLILSATLKNRAPYPQSWPALELTLTDAQDTVVARRVLSAPDYLPPKADPVAFAASSETAVRLWVEAKEVGAAGYRLYVFYP